MADETDFFVDIGNDRFKVQAKDMKEATRLAKQFQQEELNTKAQSEFTNAPSWAKPFMAAGDLALTSSQMFGAPAIADWALDTNLNAEVNARRARMGSAALAGDVVTAMGAMPTVVPKAMAMMGGGPLARGMVGGGAAAAEGATVGGLQALSQDQPMGETAAAGAVLGPLAHSLGPAVNKISNLARGISPTVPSGGRAGITQIPPGITNPSRADKVNVAHNVAESLSRKSDNPLAYQGNIKEAMEEMLRVDRKSFTPEQRAMMGRIVGEDPATKISRGLGNYLSNKWAAAGAGVTAGAGINPVIGLLTGGGLLGAGRIMKSASAGGTAEAMRDLRRSVMKMPEYRGLLSTGRSGRLAKGARQYGLDEYLYPEE